jgi:uncharacterized protein (TIGR02266 family)
MSGWIKRLFGSREAAVDVTEAEPCAPTADAATPVSQGSLAMKQEAERRHFARVALQLQVRLRFETAEAMTASRTFDISRSGAFIAIREPRPRGTKVRLTVEVDDMTIVLAGVIVRVSDGRKDGRRGMGIQFTEVTPQAAEALGELLGPRGG